MYEGDFWFRGKCDLCGAKGQVTNIGAGMRSPYTGYEDERRVCSACIDDMEAESEAQHG